MNISRFKKILLGVGLLAAVIGVTIVHFPAVETYAADHRDGPVAIADPTADITDIYAWMSPDSSKVNLIMNVFPDASATATFGEDVQYVFHLNSMSAYGMTATETMILCTFDSSQDVSCWLSSDNSVSDYVSGDASGTDGITSVNSQFKIFTGMRDDPFFFNLTGFNETVSAVAGAAGALTFDAANCPALDGATSTALVNQLKTGTGGVPAENDFAGQNVMSIVIEADTATVTPGGAILGVWASTHRS